MSIQDGAHVLLRRKRPPPRPKHPQPTASMPRAEFQKPADCPLAECSALSTYERELQKHRATEAKLKRSLLREHALLRQRNDLIQQKDILSKESEHRLLNGLQLVTSLLSIQSRATRNAEAAAQLTAAAHRVDAIGRIRAHSSRHFASRTDVSCAIPCS